VSEAVRNALHSPLLGDLSVKGATGALIHVIGGPDLSLEEATRVADIVTRQMRHDARIIWGARVLSDFTGYVRVLLIVTGLEGNSAVLPGFRGHVEVFDGLDWGALQLYRLDANLASFPVPAEGRLPVGTEEDYSDVFPAGPVNAVENKETVERTEEIPEPPVLLSPFESLEGEPLGGLGLKRVESASSAEN
jgi:hypothetical protein